ncbi:MAG TPA: NAD(P)H-hydrate dehydratase [Burkholderiales bacterium]|nr:NAD(P)H-hydrate dehydratase [Burkholderiales bacterium]
MPQPVYLAAEIRRIEQAAAEARPPLMERAGAAAAELAIRLCGDKTKDIVVLAGPGNNGGDAKVVARILQERFFRVSLSTQGIPEKNAGLVIDGLFGIGLARPIEGPFARLVDWINAQPCPVLALDVPSGLDADTGRVLGRAVRATHTITFIGLKPGLLTLDGPDHCGEICVSDLSLSGLPPTGWVAEPALFTNVLKVRPRNFHKGMAGSVGILGGAEGMTGAALLAGRAALKMGAGRVYVGLLEHQPVDESALELMVRNADDLLGLDLDSIVIGPGLGQSERAETLLGAVLASDIPCVLDADALSLIAANEDLRRACAKRAAETLLTPHPAEAGRLLAETTAHVQEDRLKAARALSANLNAHVVLKGAGSILVARDGHWFVNTSGNPGMASAGMGDVLAGILGALLAQKLSGESALVLGVHLHGSAADECVRSGTGPVGLTASETITPARRIWNSWLAAR